MKAGTASIEIIRLDPENVDRYGIGCIRDRKHEGYQAKVKWFKQNFGKGLRILMALKSGKYAGFLEYAPGEHAWRPVNAAGYLFIHCIWVYPNKNTSEGLGSKLIDICLSDAQKGGYNGVAVMTSQGPWMADSRLFLRSGFTPVETSGRFELLVHKTGAGADPAFIDTHHSQSAGKGLTLLYSHQCPANARTVREIKSLARGLGVELTVRELESDDESRGAPSVYGVFQLVNEGKVLSDHYLSATRFRNILREQKII